MKCDNVTVTVLLLYFGLLSRVTRQNLDRQNLDRQNLDRQNLYQYFY